MISIAASRTSVEVASEHIAEVSAAVNGFIRGKAEVVDLAVTCLLAQGHLLLDDVPGVGKTSLARALSASLGLEWNRIQFTPDVLPSDVTGVSVFHKRTTTFEFHPGPIFASVVLADEINRASPRTQSALLEAMEERTVSVDGVTHQLPSPFMVIATQNPVDMAGTYPLPEAQLDRFLMSTSIGYPSHEAEVEVVTAHHAGASLDRMQPALPPYAVADLIATAAFVAVAPEIVDYIVRIVGATRSVPGVLLGASPRGSIGLLRACRARALAAGRGFVAPGDVQALAQPVLAHRLILDADAEARAVTAAAVIAQVIDQVPAPQPS